MILLSPLLFMTEDQTKTHPKWNLELNPPTSDPFAELVHSLHQSLLPSVTNLHPTPTPVPRPIQRHMQAWENCRGFLLQCSLLFENQAEISAWDFRPIDQRPPILSHYSQVLHYSGRKPSGNWMTLPPALLDAFTTYVCEVFGETTNSLSMQDQLRHLRQGRLWNEAELISAYLQGLPAAICGLQHQLTNTFHVDSFQLSQAECQHHINNHLCLYCGSEGHLLPCCRCVHLIQRWSMIAT